MPPELFYISPEWDDLNQLTSHSLVWNALDGNHDKIDAWNQTFRQYRRMETAWKAPSAMLQLGKKDTDFIAVYGQTFAIKATAWNAIKDLMSNSVEALPVDVTRKFYPERFGFPLIPANERSKYLLLHGFSNVPTRHGQKGYWDVDKNRYDLSFGQYHGVSPDGCKLLWLDPEEFAAKHLFLIDGEWVASPEFVERVKAKKLSGLVFHPIKYQVKARQVPPKLRKLMPEPPRPDFAAAAVGYSPKLVKQWRALWDWTIEAMKNRGWGPRKPKIMPPIDKGNLEAFEAKHKIKLPKDYADVLTKFASGVSVDLGNVEPIDPRYAAWEEIDSRTRNLMFGRGMVLWSFDVPTKEYAGFKKWGDELADAYPDSEYHQHFRNKVPILNITNGDYITLDLKTGVPTYVSHEGDERVQGKPLGKNFADFITRWSWTCVPWPDFLPGSAFYDEKSSSLPESSPTLTLWHTWLRGLPLPSEGAAP